ncbi:hypothetical protein KDA_06390 [Dictyobacter alpinus]|uniref:F5/8 type C domain-containing protein n=1 Tax=Dictyobacter alpinus TaxID=2014873 RepID=A0A402B1B7_9CHLR|nr:discoidin domain-containing protein [Dictyobacter alpinus]GCE25155.1 hypothetical protein KDA_06390 [Dictyobacter alpinus]
MKEYHSSRKHFYVVLLLLMLLGSTIGTVAQTKQAHADSPNLVQNGGFEDSLTPWYDFGGTAQTSSSVTHSGKGALVMGTGQQGAGQSLTLEPNTYYSFSGWGKTTGSGEYAQITLRVVDGSGGQVDYQMPFTLSDWTRQARTILTPPTVSSVILYVLKSAGSGYFYADDLFVGVGRDVEAWPLATNSIWNTSIGSSAVYKPVNLIAQDSIIEDDFPVIYGDANAPRRDAFTAGSTSANDFGFCNQDPSKGSVGIPQGTMQIPDSYTINNWTRNPNYTPNNAGIFVQGDGRTVAQTQPLTRCDPSGPVFGYRGTDTDLYSTGNGGIHYGSGLSAIGGLIRQGELIGPAPIRHALQLEIWMEKFASNNPAFRWPADRNDYGAANNYCSDDPCKSDPGSYNSIKQGSLLAIPTNVTPESLGIKTDPGRKIFYALQDYGGYLTDDTGWYWEAMGTEKGVSTEMASKYGYPFNVSKNSTGGALDWYNDFTSVFKALQVIDNNSPTSIGGGGTPRVTTPIPDFVSTPPPAPVALDRTGWTVHASINNGDAAKMLDGQNATAWQTGQAQAQGQNFVVDLQTVQSFDQVSLDATDPAFYSAFAQGYEVDVSNDATNWIQVHAGTGSGTSPTLATFIPQQARYVRINLLNGNLNGVNSWAVGEFNLYNTNKNTQRPLDRSSWTATSSVGPNANYAIDGNSATHWSTGRGQANGDHFEVDLGSASSFSKIVLDNSHVPDEYAHGLLVYVSNDGTNWTGVTALYPNSPVTTITFSTQTARYISLWQTENVSAPWSIDELTLYP